MIQKNSSLPEIRQRLAAFYITFASVMTLTKSKMIEAMMTRDQSLDGQFYVGVHSTKIYCLPSCKAKKPLLKNVRFYDSREEAVVAGLRGCKRCWSDRYPDVLPEWVKMLMKYLRANRNVRLNESELVRIAGVDITTIRRHFKIHLGMTPIAFNRYQRLVHARELLAHGMNYLSVAYECGYESVSGFRSAIEKQFGQPAGSYQKEAGDKK